MAGKLSDYEKLRVANIARNEQFLSNIGLDGTSASSSRSSSSKTTKRAAKKAVPDGEASQPSRRSKRSKEDNDDADGSNKRSKSSASSEAAADVEPRTSTRVKKPVAFYKDEIPSIDEPKPRKGSSSSGSASGKVEVYADGETAALPTRNAKGELVFPDYPQFRPNLTPKEVLQKGSFGGTYFRPIFSRVTQQHYKDEAWKELPADWLTGLNVATQISSPLYRTSNNKYKEACGGDLDMWEGSGWITHIDPYGWFQWYCRFYQGRRSSDDERQISRGLGVMGPRGRWRNALINKCLAASMTDQHRQSQERAQEVVDKHAISPKIRQLLQHWGYQLTVDDLIAAAKSKK